jgi:small subunit ribosomal protein S6
VREYEFTFIIQPEISDEGIQGICDRLDGILEKNGAHKLFYDDMGKRRLGYPVQKFQKGHYLTLFYLDNGTSVRELERSLKLDDSILRYLTVLGNELVKDIDARKAEAAEIERVRAEKAAERAAREAEDAARAAAEAAEEAVRAEAEAADKAARAEAEAAAREAAGEAEAEAASAEEPEAASAGEPEAASAGKAEAAAEEKGQDEVAPEAGAAGDEASEDKKEG